MANEKPKKNGKKIDASIKKSRFSLPVEVKQKIWGVLTIILAIIITLAFFDKAGVAGSFFIKGVKYLIGQTVFVVPIALVLAGLAFLGNSKDIRHKHWFWPVIIAIALLLLSVTGFLSIFNPKSDQGGLIGSLLSWPLMTYFGLWASFFILLAPCAISLIIFWQFLKPFEVSDEDEDEEIFEEIDAKKQKEDSFIKKIFAPKFKVKEISPDKPMQEKIADEEKQFAPKETARINKIPKKFAYDIPPIDLLDKETSVPTSGDTKSNAAIIKKTLLNFGIDVTMSDINIGPTVTQYSLKPAEGVKLSKITGLSNDLALALAAHPIRIEAPIPGKSLVGVEIPNKVRASVRLRELIESPIFQKSTFNLILPLGKDVSGFPIYTDLARMPHMLVAGSTGTGKTIFLNQLITSLLYQPHTAIKSAGPDSLRLILVDPKRVEFSAFSNLPHLLCPVIYNATQTVIALKWLIGEMERRFDVLSEAKCRDINSFNEKAIKEEAESLPYIVLIVDELADLMLAKGREIEAGIVRLAQMARAVGIHLIVATQRPSVEVITGLIKANITSRVTFQVASQIDSRTVIDCSGAEKLLGAGDMLYISNQVPKPKRIQGPYVSDREVKKVVAYVTKPRIEADGAEMDSELVSALERGVEDQEKGGDFSSSSSFDDGGSSDDPLFEEAKKVVREAQKASASLLQRRLRLGYARAARLIDMLEDKGIVGPGDGAKPREVYGPTATMASQIPDNTLSEESDDEITGNGQPAKTQDGWKKI